MFVTCWSVKGGSGTTVVAACLAVIAARNQGDETLLVDLAGDLPAALGVDGAGAAGIGDWIRDTGAHRSAHGEFSVGAPGSLAELAIRIDDTLSVLPQGTVGPEHPPDGAVAALITRLRADGRTVIVDAGTLDSEEGHAPAMACVGAADRSLLVTRACYLGLRHVTRTSLRPDGAVLVAEPGRSLGADDVASVVGAPVLAEIRCEPQVARLVDAGLLHQRVPRALERSLADLVKA